MKEPVIATAKGDSADVFRLTVKVAREYDQEWFGGNGLWYVRHFDEGGVPCTQFCITDGEPEGDGPWTPYDKGQ